MGGCYGGQNSEMNPNLLSFDGNDGDEGEFDDMKFK